MPNKIIKTFYAAGVSFRPAAIIDALGANERIRLVAEPTNKVDPNAIKLEALFQRELEDSAGYTGNIPVEETWEHIGYVPKGDTWLFHLLRELNVPIKAVLNVNPSAEPHRMLLITAAVEVTPELPFQ